MAVRSPPLWAVVLASPVAVLGGCVLALDVSVRGSAVRGAYAAAVGASHTALWRRASAVFVWSLLTVVCTGLGALPLAVTRTVSKRAMCVANALALGMMLAASAQLVAEGAEKSVRDTACGALVGYVLMVLANHFIVTAAANNAAAERAAERAAAAAAAVTTKSRHGDDERSSDSGSDSDAEELDVAALQGASLRKAALIVGVMTLHSAAEGIGLGVAFGDSERLGTLISTSLAVHNVPEGLAIALVLVPRGWSVTAAAVWSVVSSVPQALTAVPAFVFVDAFARVLPAGLGLAAGAMVWMVTSELLPEALEHLSPLAVATIATCAGAPQYAVATGMLDLSAHWPHSLNVPTAMSTMHLASSSAAGGSSAPVNVVTAAATAAAAATAGIPAK